MQKSGRNVDAVGFTRGVYEMKVYFSDIFDVSPDTIEKYKCLQMLGVRSCNHTFHSGLGGFGVIHKKVGPARFTIFSIGWRYC